MAYFSSLSGVDLGCYDPATLLADMIGEIPGIRGAFQAVIDAWPVGEKPTVRDFLTTAFAPQMVVGSPETIADRLDIQRRAGVDGIQIMNVLLPGSYDEFFDEVVPVLQRRGLMQTSYRSGTLREKLFGAGDHVNERHPAHSYRGMFANTAPLRA